MTTFRITPDTVTPDEASHLMDLAARLAQEAACIINDIRARGFEHAFKADNSVVTEADTAAERHILAGLRRACPDIAAISEEEYSADQAPEATTTYWLIDPLDGTRGFASGDRDFTVNIGLVCGDRPVLGVVALPGYDLLYKGGIGLGAVRVQNGMATPIEAVRVPANGVRVLASNHHNDPALLTRWLDGRTISSLERVASSVKFMRIAEGGADFYPRFGPTMEWDTAAPQAILEAAGGRLCDSDHRPLSYGKPGRRNPAFYCMGRIA